MKRVCIIKLFHWLISLEKSRKLSLDKDAATRFLSSVLGKPDDKNTDEEKKRGKKRKKNQQDTKQKKKKS